MALNICINLIKPNYFRLNISYFIYWLLLHFVTLGPTHNEIKVGPKYFRKREFIICAHNQSMNNTIKECTSREKCWPFFFFFSEVAAVQHSVTHNHTQQDANSWGSRQKAPDLPTQKPPFKQNRWPEDICSGWDLGMQLEDVEPCLLQKWQWNVKWNW